MPDFCGTKKKSRFIVLASIKTIITKNVGETDLKCNFKLVPSCEILNIRKSAPTEKAEFIKGDAISYSNGKRVYRLSLEEINQLLKAEDQNVLTLIVERDGTDTTFRFQTIDLL